MTYRLFDPVLEKIKGAVICTVDGKETVYPSVKELLDQKFTKKNTIAGIAVKNGNISIELVESSIVPNDLTSDWAKEHMAKTGREISFF